MDEELKASGEFPLSLCAETGRPRTKRRPPVILPRCIGTCDPMKENTAFVVLAVSQVGRGGFWEPGSTKEP